MGSREYGLDYITSGVVIYHRVAQSVIAIIITIVITIAIVPIPVPIPAEDFWNRLNFEIR